MRKALLLIATLFGACSTAPVAIPVHGVAPGHVCTAAATAQFVGQTATQESGRAILAASNAAVLRWAPPGVLLTMDFREDRVTVRTGPSGKITAINCG